MTRSTGSSHPVPVYVSGGLASVIFAHAGLANELLILLFNYQATMRAKFINGEAVDGSTTCLA